MKRIEHTTNAGPLDGSARTGRGGRGRRVATLTIAAALGVATFAPLPTFAEEASLPADEPMGQGAEGTDAPAAQAAESLARSSDKGSYEQAGLYQLTIRYVDAAGTEIAPARRLALREGEKYDVASPKIAGLSLSDPGQKNVSGTVSGPDHDRTVTVSYKSATATYRVVHRRKVACGPSAQYVEETETLSATVGTVVRAAPKTYEGCRCVTPEKERSCIVTADGKASVTVEYEPLENVAGIYFETNGSYVAPITGAAGTAVTAPQDPTRKGYAFAGWDTNGDGAVDALPAKLPEATVIARAVWEPAETTYLVRYWGEAQDKPGDYRLLETRTKTGTTDAMTPKADALDENSEGEKYWFYDYARESAPKRINADGTTVIDVYYDLRMVEVRLFAKTEISSTHWSDYPLVDKRTVKLFSHNALPAQADALKAYKDGGGVCSKFENWYIQKANGSASVVSEVSVDAANYVKWVVDPDTGETRLVATYYAGFTNADFYPLYNEKLYENAEGTGYDSPDSDAKTYSMTTPSAAVRVLVSPEGFKLVGWRQSVGTRVGDWTAADRANVEWGEWQAIDESKIKNGRFVIPSFPLGEHSCIQFKYDRLFYDVNYYSRGDLVKTDSRRFGSSAKVSSPDGLKAPDGMVFAGWYDNEEFKGEPVDELTVPVGGCNLYAKWAHPDVNVTFDSAGGSKVESQTIGWKCKAERPADPVREGYRFAGWYLAGADGARLSPFSFDLEIEDDTHVVAAWVSERQPVLYTVVHQTADGRVLATQAGSGIVGETLSVTALGAGDARRAGLRYVDVTAQSLDLVGDAVRNVLYFTYSDEVQRHYTVHFVDAETGEKVAEDRTFDSYEVLVNALAESVEGWTVRNGGTGYLLAEGDSDTVELTFLYDRNDVDEPSGPTTPAEPTTPSTPSTPLTPSKPSDNPAAKPQRPDVVGAQVPATGDRVNALLPMGAFAGAIMAAMGFALRRRRND